MKKIILFLISVIILIAIIIFADPVKLFQTVKNANIFYILIGLIVGTISISLRTVKWQVLLNKIGFRELWPVQTLGMSISNFTPGKVGEPFKALILKANSGIPVSQGMSSIIMERIIDVIVLVIYSIFGLFFISLGGNFLLAGYFAITIFTIGILVLIGVVFNQRIGWFVYKIIKKFPLTGRITENFMKEFYKNVNFSKRRLIFSLILTFFIWFLDSVVLYFSLLSIGINSNIMMLTGLNALSTIIGVASALPGGLGGTEAGMSAMLAITGVSATIAVAGVMITRVLTFWYCAFLGLLSFIYLSKKIGKDNLRKLL